MAKGFIDQPQEGECVQQWSGNLGPGRQNSQLTQTGQGSTSRHTSTTPEDERSEDCSVSSASSQETLPSMSASVQESPQQSPASSQQSLAVASSQSSESSQQSQASPEQSQASPQQPTASSQQSLASQQPSSSRHSSASPQQSLESSSQPSGVFLSHSAPKTNLDASLPSLPPPIHLPSHSTQSHLASLPPQTHLPTLPPQTHLPAHPPTTQLPSRSSQSQESSPQSFPTRSPPLPMSSPSYLPNQPSISVEELHELAIQDSANNNVDENSNDQQYDRYANYPNYHQEYAANVQYTPDQSVRPRVRRGGNGDETDRAPQRWPEDVRQSGSSHEGAGFRNSHRRNLSDGLPYSSSGYRMESSHAYPPLPNLGASAGHNQARYHHHGSEHARRREEWSRGPRSWLPFGDGHGPPQPPEDTTRGARELLFNFTTEVLHSHHLNVPQDVRAQSGFSNPAWLTAGRELRQLADTFAKTEERSRVRCMAETVNMQSINMENFFQLCSELFSGGITRERIVALFTFVGDVAVYQVQRRGEQFLHMLLNWSLKYLVDYVCSWVQNAGGWVVVLGQGASILYQTAVFAFCVLGTVAAGTFIFKTYKDW